MRDHEIDATRVRSILDTAVNVELQKHLLQPGGTAAGDIRVWCARCEKALKPDAIETHLKWAAARAISVKE